LLTVFAIVGLVNAYNIIDGLNGISSMVGIITLTALAYTGFNLGDLMVVSLSLSLLGSILGFFFWNYPKGKIFLGDGGAYLIGFWIGALSIWICNRHQEVSPWFPLLINAYPVSETIFTIYRRIIQKNKNVFKPDSIHLHGLIYHRILMPRNPGTPLIANAKTAPFLWTLSALSTIPAVLFWDSTFLLVCFSLLFFLSYLWFYKRILNFKVPKIFRP
jgi:UDP-N-acetylmuramyl pentapeptide phosphotransferase/UDP-N-acetylglucosamine-1-phosphate transferase